MIRKSNYYSSAHENLESRMSLESILGTIAAVFGLIPEQYKKRPGLMISLIIVTILVIVLFIGQCSDTSCKPTDCRKIGVTFTYYDGTLLYPSDSLKILTESIGTQDVFAKKYEEYKFIKLPDHYSKSEFIFTIYRNRVEIDKKTIKISKKLQAVNESNCDICIYGKAFIIDKPKLSKEETKPVGQEGLADTTNNNSRGKRDSVLAIPEVSDSIIHEVKHSKEVNDSLFQETETIPEEATETSISEINELKKIPEQDKNQETTPKKSEIITNAEVTYVLNKESKTYPKSYNNIKTINELKHFALDTLNKSITEDNSVTIDAFKAQLSDYIKQYEAKEITFEELKEWFEIPLHFCNSSKNKQP